MTETSSLPFSSLKPLKFIGINQTHPFCSILSESKLIYMSGTHLITENTKNNEQKIIWNNTFTGHIHLIEHQITLYNDHILAIAIRDLHSLMNVVVVLPLNNIQNSKERCHVHYLRHIQQYESITQIHFYEEGSLFAVVSQYKDMSTLSLCRTSTGDVVYKQSFCSTKLKLSSIAINKLNCLSLLQHDNKGEVRLRLIIVQDTSRSLYYNIGVQKGETVLSYYYETFQEENIMMALTSTGFILTFKINQFQLTLLTRIDVRINNTTINKRKRQSIQSIQYQLPTAMQAASHKLILAYQQPVHIAILSFSTFNPKITNFILVDSALDNYPHIKGVKHMKACKDNCNLVATFKIDPLMDKALASINQTDLFDQNPNSTNASVEYQIQAVNTVESPDSQLCSPDQYIVMQIDILSNTIDHEQHALSVQQTFTVCSGHSFVESVKYCPYNNSMFMLMRNKALLYYNLTPKQLKNQIAGKSIGYTDFRIGGLLMWKHLMSDQPLSMAVHPFNFTLVLIYADIIKFHSYNTNNLYPAFLVTSIKNCKSAVYSPLGDTIVFATNGAVTIVNSYTYQVVKTVLLPNIIGNLVPKRVSKTDITKVAAQTYAKAINKVLFIDNDDLLVFSGSNTVSLIINQQKAMHFGFIERQAQQKYQQMVYDQINHLAVLSHEDHTLVLAKCSLNTNNRCEVISRIQIAATALQVCTALAVLFIGGKDGTLYMIKWPDYCASDLGTERSLRYRLFDEPIVHISTSANMNYLFAVSQAGSICINELVVNHSEQGLSRHLKTVLIKISQIPLKVNDQWPMSRNEEEKKEREIIKLRGQEADISNRHNALNREGETSHQQQFLMKKSQLESDYLQELKQYEEHYGLQRLLREISMLRDELKLALRQRPRGREEAQRINQLQLHDVFEAKKQLEQSLLQCKVNTRTQKDELIAQQQTEIQNMQTQFELQQQQLIEAGQSGLMGWNQKTSASQITNTNIEQDYTQNKEGIQKDFNQDLKAILDSNQAILSKNRSLNIHIREMQDKMGSLNIQRQKLEVDLYKILHEQEELTDIKEALALQDQHHKTIQDKLIRNSKEQQQKLMLERKIKEKYELNIAQIEQDVEHLRTSETILEDKYKEINNNFILEREVYAEKCNTLQQMTSKLHELKAIKKQRQYSNLLSKNHYQQTLKTIMRNIEVDKDRAIQQLRNQYSVYCQQERGEPIVLTSEFQRLKKGHEKLALDAMKWGELKQTYMAGFFKNYGRLNSQKLKLTYQYNDLVKVSQDYKMYISYLQREIQKVKKTSQEQHYLPKTRQSLKPIAFSKKGCSFINTSNDLLKTTEGRKIEAAKHIKKQGICVSLHSQNNDRFITEV